MRRAPPFLIASFLALFALLACQPIEDCDVPASPDAGPAPASVDWAVVKGSDQTGWWCLVLDRFAFAAQHLSAASYMASGEEACPYDTDCNRLCASAIGYPAVEERYFVACDPFRRVLTDSACLAPP